MVIWSEKMYIGDAIRKKSARVQKKLEGGKFVPDVFLITAPTNEANLFDILPTRELLFPYHKKRDILVYGIAKSKDEAVELVTEMLEDMYRDTGGLCSKEYFAKS